VHVAEGRREHVAAALDLASASATATMSSGVVYSFSRGRALVVDAVLLAADDPGLDLEDDLQLGALAQQLRAIFMFSASGSSEPSNMCDENRFGWPAARRRRVSASSGRMNLSSLSAGQWSVWIATLIG
jgi:hypothetical protein